MKVEKLIQWIGTNWKALAITVIVLLALYYIFKITGIGKDIKQKLKPLPKATLPDGQDGSQAQGYNPTTNMMEAYNPRQDVIRIKNAMEGFGTDEQAIFDTLEGKNDGQLVAIYNDFGSYTGDDLFEWFNDDLNGNDLARAMAYFDGIIVN